MLRPLPLLCESTFNITLGCETCLIIILLSGSMIVDLILIKSSIGSNGILGFGGSAK